VAVVGRIALQDRGWLHSPNQASFGFRDVRLSQHSGWLLRVVSSPRYRHERCTESEGIRENAPTPRVTCVTRASRLPSIDLAESRFTSRFTCLKRHPLTPTCQSSHPADDPRVDNATSRATRVTLSQRRLNSRGSRPRDLHCAIASRIGKHAAPGAEADIFPDFRSRGHALPLFIVISANLGRLPEIDER
jgi:hypothetical protein